MSAKSSKSTPTSKSTATRKTAAASKSTASKTTAISKPAAISKAAQASKAVRARVAAVSKSASAPQVTRNNPSKLFSANGKNQSGPLTSEAIATDLAAFKKAGGRIEVLGNTPTRTTSTAFRSAGNTARTAPAPAAATATATAAKSRS